MSECVEGLHFSAFNFLGLLGWFIKNKKTLNNSPCKMVGWSWGGYGAEIEQPPPAGREGGVTEGGGGWLEWDWRIQLPWRAFKCCCRVNHSFLCCKTDKNNKKAFLHKGGNYKGQYSTTTAFKHVHICTCHRENTQESWQSDWSQCQLIFYSVHLVRIIYYTDARLRSKYKNLRIKKVWNIGMP